MNSASEQNQDPESSNAAQDGSTDAEGQAGAVPPIPTNTTVRELLLEYWLGPMPKLPAYRVLITINLIVFAATCLASGFNIKDIPVQTLLLWGADYGPFTLDGEYWRLLSSLFLHGGLIHIAMNMVVLMDIARTVERLLGTSKFLLVYFVAGIGGGLFSLFFTPDTPSVGASGAIFGVYGALLAFFLRHRSQIPTDIMLASSRSIGAFIVFNLVFGFVATHTDNAAHIGGLIFGFLQGFVLLNKENIRSWGLRNILGTLAVALLAAGAWHLDTLGLLDKRGALILTKVQRLIEEKQSDQAIAMIDQLAKERPDSDLVYEIRGVIYLQLGQMNKALLDAEQALKLNPENRRALLVRAEVNSKAERYDEALADIDKAISLAPTDLKARAFRMFTLIRMNRFQDALAESDWVMKNGAQESPQLILLRVTILAQLGRTNEALELCDTISKKFPQLNEDVELARNSVLQNQRH